MPRLLTDVALIHALDTAEDPHDPAGHYVRLLDERGVEIGIWQTTPGTRHDVEDDEVLVVIAGSATVTFGDGEVARLRPGAILQLHADDRTEWVVHRELRAVYVVLPAAATGQSAPTSQAASSPTTTTNAMTPPTT